MAQERATEMDLSNNLQKKHLHPITQEQALMRYNENTKIPRFRVFKNIVYLDGPPGIAAFRN